MKILAISDRAKYERMDPEDLKAAGDSIVFVPIDASVADAVSAQPDAEVILADAISPVSAELIAALPKLRMICSEGVAYNKIDCAAAAGRGVYVTNGAGMNAGAVAEQAILLMLGLLRKVTWGDCAVRAGKQIEAKNMVFANGEDDLMDMTVGIVGLGAIGKALAARLVPFGCRVIYTSRHRKKDAEDELGIEWLGLLDLLVQSDIVILNCAVTPETTGMVNDGFLAAMKSGSYLINTARGDLVNNEALARALESGHLAGAGLDTVAPEPVTSDNPLLNLSDRAAGCVLFSPHVGGITTGSLRRLQRHMWANVHALERGERPTCVVNGI